MPLFSNSFEKFMKKITVILLVFATLFSCRSVIIRNDIEDGTWMIGEMVFNAAYVKKADTTNALTAADFSSNGLNFYFGKYPTGNSNYKIVNNPGADDEVRIVAVMQDTTRAYVTTGSEEKNAKVTFNNGKITISVPKVEAKNIYAPEDVINIEALLTEK